MSISLLEQAKAGDAAAIASLMNQALQSKGISVRGDRSGDCLQLWLTGQTLPPQAATVDYVRRGIGRLQTGALSTLQIYADQAEQQEPGWGVEVALSAATAEVNPLPREQLPVPEPDLPATRALDPEEVTEPTSLSAAPGTIPSAYALLGLTPGDSLQKVEGSYFKLKALALREGDRAKVEALKQAFHQLKQHIENPPAKTAEPSIQAKNSSSSSSSSTAEAESLTPVEQIEKLLKQRRVLAQVNIQGDQLHISWLAIRVTNAEAAAKQVHALLAHQNLAAMGLHGVKTLVISALSRDQAVVWQQTYPLTKA
ncbi:hypothetical protein IQ254_15240 [Nodosilinea sp. LEGE 07088]|uniref:hypothetical protein n=1 Tax=Nodosilinea sp. LEGE 07088 TaxID=2777968 RepID=UPI001881EE0B|nr:hypothetical protein [Nodosilinea sp. LEGE 07088]MBE9138528.1 hypothetical protein [Nodosilinea sp. LEGE 07088]